MTLADYATAEWIVACFGVPVMAGAVIALGYSIVRGIRHPRWFGQEGAPYVFIPVIVFLLGVVIMIWPQWRSGQRDGDRRFAQTIEANYKASIAKVTRAQIDQHHVWYTTRSGRQCDASTHDDAHYGQVLIRGTVSCNDKFHNLRGHLPGADPKVPQR